MALIKDTALVAVITLISRIFGYIRDIIIAAALGTGPLNDAFIAAFKLANLFRNIFGEGALTTAFVPIFSGNIANDNWQSAIALAARVQAVLITVLIIFTAIIVAAMPFVITVITPGFALYDPILQKLTIELARITFPYLIFISIAAFYGAILNSINRFMPFAATSIILNLSIILFTVLYESSENKVYSVAYGIIIAGIIEVLWMLIYAKKYGITLPLYKPKITADITILIQRMGSCIIGAGIAQVHTWCNMILASFIAGGMSYLYYADRMVQLPLAVIGTATVTTLFPKLSRTIAQSDKSSSSNILDEAIKLTLYFIIPSSFTLSIFSHDITSLLFERGHFNSLSTKQTAAALTILACGLPASIIIKICNSVFYAHCNIKVPVRAAAISLLLNISISVLSLKILQHVGIALGAIVGAWCNVYLLVWSIVSKQYYRLTYNTLFTTLAYILISLVTIWIMQLVQSTWFNTNAIMDTAVVLGIGVTSYILISCIVFKRYFITMFLKMFF